MAQVKGSKELADAILNLKELAEEVRNNLQDKEQWWDERTEKWQDGENAEAWKTHFSELETVLDEIENLTDLEL